ncbi:LuxR C-terminal-related transcriptional regulator [Spirillospora sp. NPDC047279]|uniref:LuxR C-terminal-related transcriptional regulator n=1 Tax=Spirillospora sp. NPDC047279 TaxID=3155478 RepID=UPI0033DB9850
MTERGSDGDPEPDVPARGRPVAPDRIDAVHRLIDSAIGSLTELQRAMHTLGRLEPPRAPRQGRGVETLPPESRHRLTAREREVLELLVDGRSNRQIARRLRISEPTVKNHLHAIFLKLDVTDRARAIAKVLG